MDTNKELLLIALIVILIMMRERKLHAILISEWVAIFIVLNANFPLPLTVDICLSTVIVFVTAQALLYKSK